ncbi:MAG: UPF0182 family protein [Propionibacteriaceae bacterium]|nr:UPF0182 family protein [Propionibacteriaceae bacterium]
MSTAPAPRRGRALLPVVVAVALLVWLFTVFSGIWTDQLWFSALGFSTVFWTQLWTRVGLFAVSAIIMAVAVAVTIHFVLRAQPARLSPGSSAQAVYQEVADRYPRAIMLAPAIIVGIVAGMSSLGLVPTFLAWKEQVDFGQSDFRFGLDASFYVFDYPWYRAVVSYFLGVMIVCGIIAVIGHFLLGGLFAPLNGPTGRRVTTKAAHRHISIMAALVLIGYGLSKLLDRYGLLVTSGQLLDGLTYTGDHSRVIANLVIAVIAFFSAVLFVVAIWRAGWRLPVTSVVLMVASSVVIGMIYPSFVQSFEVNPDEPDKEAPYISANIEATRTAYDIADVEIADYSATTTAAAGQLRSDAEALPGIRLIDPQLAQTTFEQLQQVRGYYSFSNVLDVDRYTIDGQETDVVIGAREMDQAGLQNREWNNIHTVYTHGYGLVAAYGNRRQSDGSPDWLARDIPTVGELKAEQPRIYYGEMTDDFVVVGRAEGEEALEFDTPGGGAESGEQYNTYDGSGGVEIGNILTRGLYALRFSDYRLLLSDRVNGNSKILYDREPRDRVQAVAPWLTIDSDIYPAIVDGRIVWIVDAYTTSNSYPNSYKTSIEDAISDSMSNQNDPLYALTSEINYIRNSVKAVVDAYDGTVKLYAWDETDPILQTWMNVYPDTVQPKSEISDDLMAHLRYPEDLFKIQREVLERYHMTNSAQWYAQSDLWRVPADPVAEGNVKESTFYLSIKWPDAAVDGETVTGDDAPVFSQTAVYTPNNRENLAAYMSVVAEATSPDYGTIRVLRMSDTQQIEGPGQAFNSITASEEIASLLRPYLNQGASSALYGNLLTIPLGGGLLYVDPIYTQNTETEGSFPVLRYVVVRFGNHIGVSDTLQGALDQVFSGDAGATTGEQVDDDTGGGDGGGEAPPTDLTRDQQIQAALGEAEAQFTAADEALRNGDLAAYQTANEAAHQAVQRAVDLVNS